MSDHILRTTNAQAVRDHDFYGDETTVNASKTVSVVSAMRDVATDYTCELCSAATMFKMCLDCQKHPAIDHRGIDEWNKDAGVDA